MAQLTRQLQLNRTDDNAAVMPSKIKSNTAAPNTAPQKSTSSNWLSSTESSLPSPRTQSPGSGLSTLQQQIEALETELDTFERQQLQSVEAQFAGDIQQRHKQLELLKNVLEKRKQELQRRRTQLEQKRNEIERQFVRT
jgi:DNA repair exonuclease SbcCD ATPase subunit